MVYRLCFDKHRIQKLEVDETLQQKYLAKKPSAKKIQDEEEIARERLNFKTTFHINVPKSLAYSDLNTQMLCMNT